MIRAIGTLPFSCPFLILLLVPRLACWGIEQPDFGRQEGRRQVGITHRHLQRLMTEQFGDAAQRRPAHHEPRREGVPQVVPSEVGNLGDLKGGMESVLDVLDRFALAGARLVWEDPRALGVATTMQGLNHPFGRGVQRQRQRATTLRAWDSDCARFCGAESGVGEHAALTTS